MSSRPFNPALYNGRMKRHPATRELGLFARYDLPLDADEPIIEARLKELPSNWRAKKRDIPAFSDFLDGHEAASAELRSPATREDQRKRLRADLLVLLAPLVKTAHFALDAAGRLDEEMRDRLRNEFLTKGFDAILVDEVLARFPVARAVLLAERHVATQIIECLAVLRMEDLLSFLNVGATDPVSKWRAAVERQGPIYANKAAKEQALADAGTRLYQLLNTHLSTEEDRRKLLNRLAAMRIEDRLIAALASGALLTDDKRAALVDEVKKAGAPDGEDLISQLVRNATGRGPSRLEAEQRSQVALAAQLRSERRLVEARTVLGAVAGVAPGLDLGGGRTPPHLLAEIDAEIGAAAPCLRTAAQVESSDPDRAYDLYEEALRLVSDFDEARQGLARCRPSPPSELRVEAAARSIQLKWKASRSRGVITYRVQRKEGAQPNSPQDGTLVAELADLAAEDTKVGPGCHVFYAVFASRNGIWSATAPSAGPVVYFAEAEQFKLTSGDRFVQGSWSPIAPTAKRVKVLRYDQEPDAGKQSVEVPIAGCAFVDRGVSNDRTYYYRLVVEYRDSRGEPLFSKGVVEIARPARPPEPVALFPVVVDGAQVVVRWPAPGHGTVTVLRLQQPPPWPGGTIRPIREVSALGPSITARTPTEAIDNAVGGRTAYYLPVTVSGDLAAVGTGQRYVFLDDIKSLTPHDFGTYLQLQWEWPEGCEEVLIVWRSDRYPTGPTDTSAMSHRVTKSAHIEKGGFQIVKPAPSPYRFVVFAASSIDGAILYSSGSGPGCRAEIRTRLPVDLSYSLSRSWIRRRAFTLTLTAAEAVDDLPEIVVVARRGDIQPVRPDNEVVVTLVRGLKIAAHGSASHRFNLDGVRPPVYLRAFFRDPVAYQRFRLGDPSPDQLKVS